MTKVLIDHQKFTTQRYGGISRYFANVIQGIKTTDDASYKLGVLCSKNHYLRQEPLPLKHIIPPSILNRKDAYAYSLNDFYCKWLLAKGDFDVFHPTYYDPYFIEKIKKPLVVTIHDMTYERLPEYFWAQDPLTRQKRLNIERADAIIAISNTTRNDILNYFNIDASKISVIYHGIDLDTGIESRPIANLPSSYLLFVGDRSGYKNFYLFLNSFKQLARRYSDLRVVLAGGGAMGIADLEFIHRLGLSDKVHHVNASDEELNFLYQNALLFVYPSLYEGFGLPILEAFKARCPMVLSDTACFREIADGAAAYFEPNSMDSLTDTLEKSIENAQFRNELSTRGSERLIQFPLQRSVASTLELYKRVAAR